MRRAELRAADAVIALLTLAVGLQEAWWPLGAGFSHRSGPPLVFSLTVAVVAVALVWRRHSPLSVVAIVNTALAGYCLAFGSPDGLSTLLPLLFSLYAAGRYGTWRDVIAASAITACGEGVHLWRDPLPPLPVGPEILFFTALVAAALAGRGVALYRHDVQVLTRRTEQLEVEREERAREAVIAERRRIAHELHDLVGHGISLVVLQVVAARGALDKEQTEIARERLERLETTARNTLAEMRRLVAVEGSDDTAMAPPPGIGDIEALVEAVRGEGMAVGLDVHGAVADLPGGIGLAAYRVVQEGLTNVMKHAAASTSTRIVVRRTATDLDVDVVDNGTGAGSSASHGRGLAGLRERVSLYGGTLDAGSVSGGGFRLHARLPLDAPEP